MSESAQKPKDGSVAMNVALRKRLLVLLAALLLVVLAGVTLYAVLHRQSDALSPFEKKMAQAGELDSTGNPKAAIKQYAALAKVTRNKNDKVAALRAKANICATQKDYQCGLDALRAADSYIGQNYQNAYFEAYYALQLGNKSQAKAYYRQVIDLLPSPTTEQKELKQQAEDGLKALQ